MKNGRQATRTVETAAYCSLVRDEKKTEETDSGVKGKLGRIFVREARTYARVAGNGPWVSTKVRFHRVLDYFRYDDTSDDVVVTALSLILGQHGVPEWLNGPDC